MAPVIVAGLLQVGLGTMASAMTVAHFVDGSKEDQVALDTNEAAPLTGVTVSSLSAVGFSGGGSITRSEFGNNSPFESTTGDWLFSVASQTVGGGGTVATPVATDDYFGFTVTNTNSEALQLKRFSYDSVLVSNDASDGITMVTQLFYSLNGGAYTEIGSLNSLTVPSGEPGLTSDSFSVNVSSLTLAENETVTFRLALGDDANTTTSRALFTQNLMLTAVPEPSAFALLGLAGLGFLRRRR